MEQFLMLVIALAALCCVTCNTFMVAKLLWQKPEKPPHEEKTPAELERERMDMEQQRLELEGLQNIAAYSGFLWRDGGNGR